MTRPALPSLGSLLVSCLLIAGLRSQEQDPFAEFRSDTDALIAEAMERNEVPGMSLLVALGETIMLAKGYGLADIEHEVPVTPATVFQIGSITKQFTAAAILKLVDAGKLRLDDKLRDLLPKYPFSDESVTVHQLLNHTSGITGYTRFRAKLAKLAYRRFRHRDFYEIIKDQPFEFEPSTSYKYSNSGYYLLGMIVEKVGGTKYSGFLTENLLRENGLTETRYGSVSRIIKHRASGYADSAMLRQTENVKVAVRRGGVDVDDPRPAPVEPRAARRPHSLSGNLHAHDDADEPGNRRASTHLRLRSQHPQPRRPPSVRARRQHPWFSLLQRILPRVAALGRAPLQQVPEQPRPAGPADLRSSSRGSAVARELGSPCQRG